MPTLAIITQLPLRESPVHSPVAIGPTGGELAAAAAVTLPRVMLASAALWVALMVLGEWQDAHLEVRYIDVDYLVFSDATASVATGGSPFACATYRYSPLLAYLLLPNSLLHPAWGKLLFSAADLLVGMFIDIILRLRGIPDRTRIWSVVAWLFNPFTFSIGTRGNCGPIVCAVILWILICLMNGVSSEPVISELLQRLQWLFLQEIATPQLHDGWATSLKDYTIIRF